MGAGRGSDGSLTIGTGSVETGREASGGNGGRAADVVRDLDTGTSAAGVGGCTDAICKLGYLHEIGRAHV